jgi:hypothetical protein
MLSSKDSVMLGQDSDEQERQRQMMMFIWQSRFVYILTSYNKLSTA